MQFKTLIEIFRFFPIIFEYISYKLIVYIELCVFYCSQGPLYFQQIDMVSYSLSTGFRFSSYSIFFAHL